MADDGRMAQFFDFFHVVPNRVVQSSCNFILFQVLRMRNPRRELNDIRFEYKPTTDSAQGIANELLATGLITNEDVEPMATNLKRLIENPPPTRVVTFTVSTGYAAAEGARDENNLVGFAQLSLTE